MSTDLLFIGYSPKDSQKALEIANRLKGAGVNIWIDSLNLLNIPAGEDPDDYTEAAIKSAKLFLIITSKSALRDESLKQEKDCARENGIERLLLKIEDCDTSKLRWKSLPSLEFHRNEEESYKTLLRKFNIDGNASVSAGTVSHEAPKISVKPELPIKEVESTRPVNQTYSDQKIEAVDVNVVDNNAQLEELLDDFEMYKFNLNNQIRNGYVGFTSLIAISVVLIAGLYIFNGLQEVWEYTQSNLRNIITIGGILPSTFSTFTYSNIKEKKKRLHGVNFFERKVSRMQKGLIPSSKQDIFELEDEFLQYINT